VLAGAFVAQTAKPGSAHAAEPVIEPIPEPIPEPVAGREHV
jgi:hypothetical protein